MGRRADHIAFSFFSIIESTKEVALFIDFSKSTVNVWFALVSLFVLILIQYLDIRELYKLTSDI